MEFVEAIRNGKSSAFLSRISKIHRKQNERFQDVLRNLEFKFEELKNFDNFDYEFGDIDVKTNIKEPKRKRAGTAESSKLLPNESVCTADLKEPLGSSTPTETSLTSVNKEDSVKKSSVASKTDACVPKTPPNKLKCPVQSESVKKRIEEFEKRAAMAAGSSASKIPILTPVKKNFIAPTVSKNLTVKPTKEEKVKPQVYAEKTKNPSVKTHIYVEKTEEIPVNCRLTRNISKVLQEKNTNIKSSKEKVVDPPTRKATVKKTSVDEARKKEEALQKMVEKQKRVAAMKERHEKEKEAKIQAVQKLKEEKLLLLKKKQLGALKNSKTNDDKLDKALESYDIEDVVDGASTDEEDNPTKKMPSWALKENRKHQLCAQAWLDKKNTLHLWFYDRSLKYPKVEELFSTAVETRPRTSSAMWNNSSICL